MASGTKITIYDVVKDSKVREINLHSNIISSDLFIDEEWMVVSTEAGEILKYSLNKNEPCLYPIYFKWEKDKIKMRKWKVKEVIEHDLVSKYQI